MPSTKEHYDQVLADVYSWMFGGFDQAVEANAAFFRRHGISAPSGSGVAIDLGAGCGFQSIPLARAGFSVTAIDQNARLLRELEEHAAGLCIRVVEDDMLNAPRHAPEKAELIVCMTDTLAHLSSRSEAARLIDTAFALLEEDGTFVVTFRDQSVELRGTDRFLPVRSDENTILTCFLEYGPEIVTVHDLVHKRENGGWRLLKSAYRKLRLTVGEVEALLGASGFTDLTTSADKGMTCILAVKSGS